MNGSLHPATTANDRLALENLMQLYAYDWSELRRADVSEEGRFGTYPLDAYFESDRRHAFLLRVDDHLAGFALVSEQLRLDGEEGFDMAEFFVVRAYRRLHVGARAATMLFDRFRGAWQVRQRRENERATAFWRKTIGDYTRGELTEVLYDDEAWRGPVQWFRAKGGT